MMMASNHTFTTLTKAIRAATIVLSLSSLLLGCQTEESGCTPGETQLCTCSSGSSGAQVCKEDGSGWGECLCESIDSVSDPDAPDDNSGDSDDAADTPTEDVLEEEVVEPTCGDGTVEGDEECDDGNGDDTDDCLSTCMDASCGDGYVWATHEECDDGNFDSSDGCVEGCVLAECGDGFVWHGFEECDEGSANSDTTPDACRTDCYNYGCGDGVTDTGESCDDGNLVLGDGCRPDCSLESCGDSIEDPGEECDDGNTDNTDACLNTCLDASCGDGFVWAGVEECDDSNTDNTDDCLDSCEDASCGDTYVHAGIEECDDGNTDNTDDCLNTCLDASCGDGFTWSSIEECDDGNTDNTDDCLNTCDDATCGDGFIHAGIEECDDGTANSDSTPDACRTDCMDAGCGDGVKDTGEECDHPDLGGNNCTTIGFTFTGGTLNCSTSCTFDTTSCTECGNSTLDSGEECDDGDLNDCNGCSAVCEFERAMSTSTGGYGAWRDAGTGGAGSGEYAGPCLTNSMTMEAWLRIDTSTGGMQAMFMQFWGYVLYINPNAGQVEWQFHKTPSANEYKDVPVPGGIALGTWHHVAVAREIIGSSWNIRTYWDGVLLDTDTSRPSSMTWCCEGDIAIAGTYPPKVSRPYYGLVDEIRLSDAAIYTSSFTPESRLSVATDTVAFWDFNSEVSGEYIDVTGNGHDLTVVDGVLVADGCHTP
jgi:cysteine-rich repeat protein